MDDFPSMKYVDDLQGYKSLFSDKLVADCAVVADASILYMYSEVALSNIRKYNSDAKILVMIRNPVEMVQSFHLQLLYNSDIGKYYEQIKRIYDLFPKEQIKIILYDDFVQSNLNVYKETLDFIGVPYDGRESFGRINDAKKPKNKFINKIVQRPPAFLMPIAKVVRKITGKPRLGILTFFDKLNRNKVDKQKLTDEFKQQLAAFFHDDIEKTARLIDRDLSRWL